MVLAIIVVALGIGREVARQARHGVLGDAGIGSLSVVVEHPMALDELPGWTDQQIKLSYHRRAALTRVVQPGEQLAKGDGLGGGPEGRGPESGRGRSAARPDGLTHDRAGVIDFRRFPDLEPATGGQDGSELNFAEQFGGTITRIKRGDLDMVAADALVLQPGDRVLAVMPRERMDEAAAFFGDSERKISEIGRAVLRAGLAAGLLLRAGERAVARRRQLPLGTAAAWWPAWCWARCIAPALVGPAADASLTIRQLGLLIFLAAVDLANGPAFAESMLTLTGLKLGLLAAVVVLATAGVPAGRAAARTIGTTRDGRASLG